MQTLKDLARQYVDLLNSPPNGWGQHVHPMYGQSHAMLWYMIKTFGDIETHWAIHEAGRGEDNS